MRTSATELIERLKQGESPESIVRWQHRAHDEVLRRCSAVRGFDSIVFDVITRDLPKGSATFDEVTRHSFVVAEPAGGYSVREDVRAEYERAELAMLRDGERVPQLYRELGDALVKLFDARDPPDEIEALYHLFAANPVAALARFERAFAEAERRYDLARCHALIEVFRVRRELADSHGNAVRDEHQRRLAVLRMWATEYHRSLRFVEPARSAKAIDALLKGKKGRLLRVWGPGGSGKTMHVRWLIARRCVPARIACALLDFDHVIAAEAARHPWLLLVAIAEQLNDQLQRRPFTELLQRYGRELDRLHRATAERSASIAPGSSAEEVRSYLASGLSQLSDREPVVIVLDTFEVALVSADADADASHLDALVETLAWLRASVPSTRIVVCGRYDPNARSAAFRRLLGDGAVLKIVGFSEAEAHEYLADRRGIADPELVEAAVAVSGKQRSPFKLALVADVIEQTCDLTPRDVQEYADADVLYLIERVIERVEPALQWLLRYGAVPRELEPAFVERVLVPYLERAITGEVPFDDPDHDPIPRRRGRRPRAIFARNIQQRPLDAAKLWEQLARYAGAASWVTREGGRLALQPEVVEPMRSLLRRHKVYGLLQREAAEYYERAAREAADSQAWVYAMRRALFHRFQHEGWRAGARWSAAIEEAAQRGGPELRLVLADELLEERAYLGDDGHPRQWDGGEPIVSVRTIAEAHFERARATADALRLGRAGSTRGISHADRDLSIARQLGAPTAAAIAPVRARLAIERGEYRAALRHASDALEAELPPEQRLLLHFDAGTARALDADPDAAREFRRALALAEEHAELERWWRPICRGLADAEAAAGSLSAAQMACRMGLTRPGDDASTADLRLTGARLSVATGRPTAALQAVRAARHVPASVRVAPEFVEGEASLARWNPERAERCGRDLTQREDDPRARAQGFELRGRALRELMEHDEALRCFDRLADAADALRDPDLACRALLRSSELQLYGAGALDDADVAFQKVLKSLPREGDDVWRRCVLGMAELASRRGRPDVVVDAVDSTLAFGHTLPAARVEIAIVGLAAGPPTRARDYLDLLCQALEAISPSPARLVLLDGLWRCPPLHRASIDGALVTRLLALIAPPAEMPPDARDAAVLAMALAGVARVVGADEVAEERLRRAAPQLVGADATAYSAHRWLAVAKFADAKQVEEILQRTSLDRHRRLGASLALEAAARASPKRANALLEDAADLLADDWGSLPAVVEERRAAVSRMLGDPVRAAEHLRNAHARYERAGDELARRRIAEELSLPVAARVGGEDAATVSVAEDKRGVVRTCAGHTTTFPPPLAALKDETSIWFTFAADELASSDAWMDRLGQILAGGLVVAERADLRLVITGDRLASLPWELARPPLGAAWRLIRCSARARSADSVRRMPAEKADDRRVLVVRASDEYEAWTSRGAAEHGTSVERIYVAAGFDVMTLDNRSFEELEYELAQTPAVVHVNAALVPIRDNVAIELGGGGRRTKGVSTSGSSRPSSDVARLTAPILARLLARAPTDKPAPLVVLDPPGPPGVDELFRQTLMRNAFASELFAIGNAGAVLAAGLHRPEHVGPSGALLARGLAEGRPLVDIAARLGGDQFRGGPHRAWMVTAAVLADDAGVALR